jgi:hypothetical protein
MAYWESLTNWSLAVNLDDLVASIPFPLAKWKTIEVETFLLSSQGSRIVDLEKPSIVYSFLVRALNLQILKIKQGSTPGSIEALCYAPLCCYRKHKAWCTELFSFRSPLRSIIRPLSPSSSVSRSYDAIMSLYHRFPQPYSRRRDRVR